MNRWVARAVSFLGIAFFFCGIPLWGFRWGYGFTEFYFRSKKIPYPFERFGVAVGMGVCFAILGVVCFLAAWLRKRRKV